MKKQIFLKISMSFFYSITLTLIFYELLSKPVISTLLDVAVYETKIPASKLIILCLLFTFLFGFVLLFLQTGLYLMGLKIFNISQENRSHMFPSITISMSIVGIVFLVLSQFFNLASPWILYIIPGITLLLNSVIYYMSSKDKLGFFIVLVISIAMYIMNGVINWVR